MTDTHRMPLTTAKGTMAGLWSHGECATADEIVATPAGEILLLGGNDLAPSALELTANLGKSVNLVLQLTREDVLALARLAGIRPSDLKG